MISKDLSRLPIYHQSKIYYKELQKHGFIDMMRVSLKNIVDIVDKLKIFKKSTENKPQKTTIQKKL